MCSSDYSSITATTETTFIVFFGAPSRPFFGAVKQHQLFFFLYSKRPPSQISCFYAFFNIMDHSYSFVPCIFILFNRLTNLNCLGEIIARIWEFQPHSKICLHYSVYPLEVLPLQCSCFDYCFHHLFFLLA